MLVHNTNRVPLRQLAIFDAEYPSEAAVAPTATHLANWRPDDKLQTVVHVHVAVHATISPTRTVWSATMCVIHAYVESGACVRLVIGIRTARSNITIRSQTNSLAMPGRLPFTGRTVVSPVWPDLDRTWGAVTVGTHQTLREEKRRLAPQCTSLPFTLLSPPSRAGRRNIVQGHLFSALVVCCAVNAPVFQFVATTFEYYSTWSSLPRPVFARFLNPLRAERCSNAGQLREMLLLRN